MTFEPPRPDAIDPTEPRRDRPQSGLSLRALVLPCGIALAIVAVGVAFALGQRSTTPARPVAPASAAAPPIVPTTAAAPAAAEAPTPPSDDDVLRAVARRMSGLRGDELTTALWTFEQRAGQAPSYAQLERNADRYAGTPVVYAGEVLEIQDIPEQQAAFIRLDLGDSGERVLAIAAMAPPGDEIGRGRRVRVYGMLNGTFSYQSQAGWNITIPKVQAVAVVLNSVPRRPANAQVR